MLHHPDLGYSDLPGGRIDKGEDKTPLHGIALRELAEELGSEFKVRLQGEQPVCVFRAFPKKLLGQTGLHLLLLGYWATHESGVPKLSSEHSNAKWVPVRDIDFSEFDEHYGAGIRAFQKIFLEELAGRER